MSGRCEPPAMFVLARIWARVRAFCHTTPVNDQTAAGHPDLPESGPPSPASPRYSLRGLAMVLTILLAVDVAAWLGAMALPVLGILGELASIVSLIVFVFWFYRARINADGRGWRQRRSPGWTIGAWFVPVLGVYYPFQIMADIWRAGLAPRARAKRAILPGIWWACFVIQPLFTESAHPIKIGPLTFYAGISIYGKIVVVLAAIMTALVVRKVSDSPLGHKLESVAAS